MGVGDRVVGGWKAEEEATENTKEGRRAIGGSNSTLLQLQRGPFSVPGPSGNQEGRGPWRRQLHAVLAARVALAASCRGSRLSWLQRQRAGTFAFSEELEKTEPSPMNPGKVQFPHKANSFLCLGNTPELKFSSPGPGAQSFSQ